MKSELVKGDSLKVLKKYDDNSIDLLCTDPPYGYSFMGRDWDKTLPPKEIFEECFRVLKPGSMAFVMSAPRSDVQYRMAEMLEKVGFRIDYTPIYWTYASGFPKAMNMSKMIDKRGAANQEDLNKWKTWFKEQLDKSKKSNKQINDECGFTATSYCKMDGKDNWTIAFPSKEKWEKIKEVMDLPNDDEYKILEKYTNDRDEFVKQRGHIETTGNLHISDEKKSIKFSGKQLSDNPYSAEAKRFDGAYGGFQPKPAVEVVIVAMKPMEEKGFMAQALKNGKAVTWLDDCRIPFQGENDYPGWWETGAKGSKGYLGTDTFKIRDMSSEDVMRRRFKNNSDYENYVKKQKSFKNAKSIGKTIKGNEHFLGGDIKQLNPAENYQKKDGTESRGWNNSSGYGRDSEPKTTKRKPRTEGSVFKESGFKSENNDTAEASPMGRFPANLLVSDSVLDDGTEKKKLSTKGATLKTMTAPDLRDVGKKSKEAIGIDKLSYGQVQNAERVEYEQWEVDETTNGYSRFFSLDEWFKKNINQLPEPVQKTFPFLIVPKASKSEKNDGLDDFEVKQRKGGGGTSNNTWYEDDVNSASGKFGSEKAPSRNIHPTVKPLTLMNYLVTLGSRKGDVVLDPFMGSGTTPLACVSLERKYIGIDNEEDYYKIAKARVDKLEAPIKAWEKFM
tara:strand:- start:13529 stop:15544 length:2016 start_codon:yes stop_codon:yes gene_type:complete